MDGAGGAEDAVAATIDVEVVLATAARQQRLRVTLPAGCTAREAVGHARAAGLDTDAAPDLDVRRGPLGVHGRHVDDAHPLRAGDRLELYRPLARDPRERRRQRAVAAARGGGG